MAWVVEDDTEAAAAPAMTTDRAKMRMASFMMSSPFIDFISTGVGLPVLLDGSPKQSSLSPLFSKVLQVFSNLGDDYHLFLGNRQAVTVGGCRERLRFDLSA
jgi:hypothetical protein